MNIRFGQQLVGIKWVNVGDCLLRITFADGRAGVISLQAFFERPKGLAAEILRGNMLDQAFIEHGALAWPNGFELCPDVLYAMTETEQAHHTRRSRAKRATRTNLSNASRRHPLTSRHTTRRARRHTTTITHRA